MSVTTKKKADLGVQSRPANDLTPNKEKNGMSLRNTTDNEKARTHYPATPYPTAPFEVDDTDFSQGYNFVNLTRYGAMLNVEYTIDNGTELIESTNGEVSLQNTQDIFLTAEELMVQPAYITVYSGADKFMLTPGQARLFAKMLTALADGIAAQ